MSVTVSPEQAPNPSRYRFVTNTTLVETEIEYLNAQAATDSPLATKIFGFPWTAAIRLSPNTIEIEKQDWVEWSVLASPLAGLIQEHLENGEAVVLNSPKTSASKGLPRTPDEKIIIEIIERDMRPTALLDGGDIQFHKFENGRVYVYFKGACSGCRSSTYTLAALETRLKEQLPSVTEVVAL